MIVPAIDITLPATSAIAEPEFGGDGWTVTACIPPDGFQAAIVELRRAIGVLEQFERCAKRRVAT